MNHLQRTPTSTFGTKRSVACTLVALLAISMFMSNARAEVLDQVPSDAAVVIKIKNWKQFSDKVASFAQQWGIAGLKPGLEDPLGAFQEESGISKGLNTDGELAVYFMSIPVTGEEPVPVALLPVSDYEAFLSNFADAKTEGDTASVTLKGEPAFVAHRGDYAVVGMNPESVAKAEAMGMKAGAAPSKELGSKDMVVHVNFGALREQLQPVIQEQRAMMTDKLDEMTGEDAPESAAAFAKYMPVLKALANQIVNVGEGFLNNGQSMTWGLMLGEAGITSTFMTDFKPGSYAADVVAKFQPTDDALVSGLPEAKYLFLGGSVSNPEVSKKLTSDFLAPIRKEIDAAGDEMKVVSSWLDAAEKYVTASTGHRFAMVSPGDDADMSQIQTLNLMIGDAATLADAQKELLASQDNLMNAFFATLVGGGEEGQEGGQAPSIQTNVTPDAKTIEGVNFTHFEAQTDPGTGGTDDPMDAIVQQVLTNMQAANTSGLFGVVDPKHFMLANGGNDEMLAAAVKAAKADEKPMASDPLIAEASKALPGKRLGVVYVPLDQVVKAGVAYANANGMQMSLELPPDLAPFSFSVTTDSNTAVRIDGFFPAQTIQALVAAGMQVGMQMQGGQQPGGPGGL